MKIWMKEGWLNKRRVIRFRAKIIKSVKHGIPKTIQKTWRVFADHAVDRPMLKARFMSEAKRWQLKQFAKWFGTPDKFPQQEEINEYHEAGQQSQPVPSVQEGGLVSDRKVGGALHEGSLGKGENSQ